MRNRFRYALSVMLFLSALVVPASACDPDPTVKIAVDATDVSRHILHVHWTLCMKSIGQTLVYPKWIPGEHGPTGPIIDLTGLKIFEDGKEIHWDRDKVDMYAFQFTVDGGTNDHTRLIEAYYDVVGNAEKSGFLLGYASTANLTGISWNQVVLNTFEQPSDGIQFTASLKLPVGWKFATALPVKSQTGNEVQFETVNLTTLVDSPVLAGRYFKTIDITGSDKTKHYLEMAADSPAALDVPSDWINAYKNVVRETGALFHARHYNDYRFLVSLHGTDMNGLEHHQSSQDLLPEFGLVNADYRNVYGYLLTHEMTHSWNGKYRRPQGLWTKTYQEPMDGDLLWVYEGLTNHLGYLLAARGGIWTQENYRDQLAEVAQRMSYRSGRQWRSLEDTAIAAQLLYFAPAEWDNWRRDVDYYQEGTLIWLEVDTIIRQQTHNGKSLDDFCQAFYGPPSGVPTVVTYTLPDVLKALKAVAPYNWDEFFQTRVHDVAPKAPLAGITNSGWKIVYKSEPTELGRAHERVHQQLDMTASLGMVIDESPENEGHVIDVVLDGPAWKSGIAPAFKIVAVNGRKYSTQWMREAMRTAKTSNQPIELIVANGDFFQTVKIDYRDGERYAHLVRDTTKPDMLTEIANPKAPAIP